MACDTLLTQGFALAVTLLAVAAGQAQTECGEFGFVCEGKSRLRLCGGRGGRDGSPAFLCPGGLMCSEGSPAVCEPPGAREEGGGARCRRPGREADRSVPGCKGYVLCVRRGAGYSALRLACPGDTLFNGVTRACTAPAAYHCPLPAAPEPQLYQQAAAAEAEVGAGAVGYSALRPRPVDCKDYKLAAGAGAGHGGAAYFCPARPARAGAVLRCTVFSDHFCLILQRDDHDQFAPQVPPAPRRPRAAHPAPPALRAPE